MLSRRRQSAHRIIVVGDIITDIVAILAGPIAPGSDANAQISVAGGGQAANTAAWLAWQAHPVTLVGCIGEDGFGLQRLAELNQLGVDCAVRRCPHAPTGTVIVLADGADRSMITQRGANLLLTAADLDAALADRPDAGHLHLSSYVLLDPACRPAGLHALAAARAAGLTVSVDAASAEPLRAVGVARYLDWIDGIDLLLANEHEAAVLTGQQRPEQAAQALTGTATDVVVKLGAAGSIWARAGQQPQHQAGQPVPVTDPTGAGDAYAAGLLAALLTGRAGHEALAQAAELGAAAVSVVGARPQPVGGQRGSGPG